MAQAPQVAGFEHEDAWNTDWLRVDSTHELYYEQYGLREGKAGILSSFPLDCFSTDVCTQ